MSRPPIVAKEIQISHNGTIFTIQVTLIGESTQVPPPSPRNVVQDNDRYSHAVANFIKGVASKYTNLNTTLGLLGNSDYLPFEALGYTVIGLHDDGVTKNPNHHKSTDIPDILDYEYLTSKTKLVLSTILGLDKMTTYDNFDYLLHSYSSFDDRN